MKLDNLVKSRHSGGNRSPENLYPFEKTGFRPGSGPGFAGMTEKHTFGLSTSSSSFGSLETQGWHAGAIMGQDP